MTVLVRQEDFRKLIEKIQWLAVITKPDITYAISRLVSVINGLLEKAWTAIKRLLRYLRGIIKVGLTYGSSKLLQGYSDAN
jgi:hypothetical protein